MQHKWISSQHKHSASKISRVILVQNISLESWNAAANQEHRNNFQKENHWIKPISKECEWIVWVIIINEINLSQNSCQPIDSSKAFEMSFRADGIWAGFQNWQSFCKSSIRAPIIMPTKDRFVKIEIRCWTFATTTFSEFFVHVADDASRVIAK